MGRAQRFEITVEGQQFEVSVQLDDTGRPSDVRVGDMSCEVELGADDALRVSAATGHQHTVHLAPGRRADSAAVAGEVLAVTVKSAREAALEAALASAGGSSGGGVVEAPMPGRVVGVLAQEGDVLEQDAPLLIIEAMKMENEVRAPVAGVVRRMAVEAGQTVEAGQLLCELADPDA